MARIRHLGDVKSLMAKALAHGARRTSVCSCTWDISGDCESPYLTEIVGRPAGRESWRAALHRTVHGLSDPREQRSFGPWTMRRDLRRVTVRGNTEVPLTVELWTRCRKCAACCNQRAKLWRARAYEEARAAPRTWFGTLTVNPGNAHLLMSATRKRLADQGVDLDTLPAAERFRERCRELGREVQLFLKRLRKQTKAPIRYLCVVERHKSGEPHLHMLVHEVSPDLPVRHAQLTQQWALGFTQWKLIADVRSAGYVTKYVAKDSVARVRASKRYGATTAYAIALAESVAAQGVPAPPLLSQTGYPQSSLRADFAALLQISQSRLSAIVTGLPNASSLSRSGLPPGCAVETAGLSKACETEAHPGGAHSFAASSTSAADSAREALGASRLSRDRRPSG